MKTMIKTICILILCMISTPRCKAAALYERASQENLRRQLAEEEEAFGNRHRLLKKLDALMTGSVKKEVINFSTH